MSDRIEEAKKRVAEWEKQQKTYTDPRIEEAKKRVEALETPKTSTVQSALTEGAKKYLDSKMNLVNMPQKSQKSLEEIKLETEKKNIQDKAWNNALKELGYTQEEIRGNAEKISEVYKQQNVELAKLDYDPKKYDYNIIKANVAGQNAMTDIISNKTSKMTFEEYEDYINSEYKKLDKYEKYKSQAYKNGNWEAVGQYEILIQNARFAEELSDMKNKYDDSTFFANYNLGQMQIDYNTAMNRYFTTDNEQDFLKAEQIRKKIQYYTQRAEKAGQGNWITKDFAEYAPQMVEQFRTGLAGALGGAIVGGGVGSVIPGAGTAAGAVKGAGVGYVGGVATFSYNQMRGAAYAELLELGVPADIAKAVAKDTALWQSIIEGAGAGVDLLALGVGKLFSKGAKTAAQLTAKKMIVNALKAYGWNLVTETAEEATQEMVAIKQEEKALEMAGIKDTRTDAEKRSRIIEAGFGGFKIALISGAGNAIGNITVSTINNATLKQTDAFYDDYIEEVKNSDLNETDKNALIKDAEEGREIAKAAIQEAIETNKPITNTQVAEKVQKTPEIVENLPENEKISQKSIQNVSNLQETEQKDTSVVEQKVADLISNNDDVYDEDVADIVNSILEEEFKDADLDDDNVYDAYSQRTQQLYKEVEQALTNQSYEKPNYYAGIGDPSYIPSQKRLDGAIGDLNVEYGKRPSNTFEVAQLEKIRANIDDIISEIETPENISISKTESNSSLDATYIEVYDETADEYKTIRVANHYKEGVSGKADYNIYIDEYSNMDELNKAIEETIREAVGNDMLFEEQEKYDVDINKKDSYNKRQVTRKPEDRKYLYKNITNRDIARVNSDYRTSKSKYLNKNFAHFDDVSYGYVIVNDEIQITRKFKGSQKFKKEVEEAWENGIDKLSDGNIKVTKSIRNAKRGSSISNGIGREQQKSRTSNRQAIRDGGQQRKTNITKTIKNNGNNLKNSDEQGSSFVSETDVSYSTNDGFYSQLEKVVSEKMPNKANPSELLNLLKKNGVKQDELDWLDLENWLGNKLEKVSKEEVMEYVKANQLKIEEVIRDDGTKTLYSEREEEVRTQMDELKNKALEILDRYNIWTWRRTDPFDRIEDFVKVHGEENIYDLADLGAFAQKSETEYYIDEDTGEFFTIEEMHKDMDILLDMMYDYQSLEEEYEQIPETSYGYADEFEDSTKYSNYKTKWDGENYREILFTIPDDRGIRPYSSPHWSEINVLAHTRLQDYKDDKNSNVLFIEEIQSDLHQEGRKHGYAKTDSVRLAQLKKEINELNNQYYKLQEQREELVARKKAEIKEKENKRIKQFEEQMKQISKESDVDFQNSAYRYYNILGWYKENDVDSKYNVDDFIKAGKLNKGINADDFKQYIEIYNKMREFNRNRPERISDSINTDKEFIKLQEEILEISQKNEAAEKEAHMIQYGVSSRFPFKKNWHEFVLRKIINEAVQQGYDKVAWTTGKQQNDRYNLARYIDAIEYSQNKEDGTFDFFIYKDGKATNNFNNKTIGELEEYVGEKIAEKMENNEGESKVVTSRFTDSSRTWHTLSGLDLEVGGEGMKGFYDKMIPDYLNKYLKKWGSKVEEVIIPDGKDMHVQQGFTITPEMRESVMSQGQTLFEPPADYTPTVEGGNNVGKKFKARGYVDLNGTKVTNAQDVADVAQIFRNPNYETFRMVYTKGDVIVGQEGITSKMPGRTKVSVERTDTINFYKTKERMRRLGADGYYMVHNHPTGRAVASKEDVDVTRAYKNNIEGFKGHIIVDHNTYAYIGNNLTPENSIEFTPTVESYNLADYLPWTDMRITSREALSKLMSEVKNNEDFSSLILTDSAGNVRNIIDIPNSFWNMSEKQIEGYIRNVSRENGSIRAFVGTTDFDVFRKIGVLQGSNITDTLLYKLKEDETVVLNATQGLDVFAGAEDKAVRVSEEPSEYEIEERKKEVAKFIEDRKAVSGTKGLTFNSNEVIDKIFEKLGVSAKGNTKQMQKSVKELNEALQSGGLTDEKIEKVVRELGKKLTESIDEYYKANKQLKDDIRSTKIYVPETVKNDIADWGDYRRSILGTVRTTNDETALPIDTFYMELQEVYGKDMFPDDIKNISDQLQRIVEVGKSIKKIDTNLEDYYNKTFGKESWEETANDLINELKLMRNAKLKEVAEPTARGGIKTRSYTKTAKKESLTEEFIDLEKLTYSIKTNLSSVGQANAIISSQGYEEALKTFQNKLTEGKRIDAVDVALGERLIQETIKRGQFEKARELIYDVTIFATELGQAVQALSIISRLSPEGQLMYLQRYAERYNAKHALKKSKKKALNDLAKMETPIVTGEQEGLVQAGDMFGKIQIPKELSDELLAAKNSEEVKVAVDKIKQALADQMEVTWAEKLNEWRYLAMLGNPKTHIRNIASNIAMRGTYEVKNTIQRVIETLADPKLEQRTRTFKKASEAVKKFAKESSKDNIDNIMGHGKYTTEQQIKNMRKIFGLKNAEEARKLNSKLLQVEDLWFSRPVYKSNLAEYLTANGIRTQKDIDLNPQLVQDAINHAIAEAQKVTFRQYSKLASQISQIENDNVLSALLVGGVVPFKKTPINIVKTAASYNPLGLIETLTNESIKLKKGLIDANTYIDRVSQGLTGTMLFGLGMLGRATGLLVASTGEDDEYKEKIGKIAPYSIKISDNYYGLSWLSPAAIPMFMGAEMYQAMQGTSNLDINDIVDVTAKTIDPLSEMSMVSSLNDALRSFSSYDNNTEAISNILLNGVESYIGQYFPTAGSQINKIIDKTIRTTRASKNSPFKFGEKIVRQNTNKLPGGSFLLEPSTDIWGNEAKRSENIVLRALDSLISPGTTTVNKATEVDEKILELYEQTGNKDIIPEIPSDYFSEGGVRYEMNAKEYTFFKKTYGQTAYTLLEELFDSSEYRSYTDAEKEKAIKDVYEKAKYAAREPIKEIAGINNEIKSTKNDLTMTRSERQDRVDELEEQKEDIMNNYSAEEAIELYDYLPADSTYKYEPKKGVKVDVTLTVDDQKEYAEIAKEIYEEELKDLKKKRSYKEATAEEKKELEKNLLSSAKREAKEQIVKKVYERNR